MHRIVYDHQTFGLQQHGGISRYFCELAARVHQTSGLHAQVVAPLHINDYLRSCNIPQTAIHLSTRNVLPGRLLQQINQRVSPLLIRVQRPSLIHRTYYAPTRPLRSVPTVVTVFDMIHELFPDHFLSHDLTSRDKRKAVDAAAHVLCISERTAQDLGRIFQVPREKISVTHLGFSDVFARAGSFDESRPHPRPYLLYVGQRGGYKNFEGALRAYAASARLRGELDFLVFGGFALSADELALIDSLGLHRNAVRRLTGSDADLACAYRHARAFIYPSKYEGFGIPPLEAMSCGCPVVCSNTSSIPEVVGDAARLFDPNQADSIRQALDEVCFDEGLRSNLVDAGHRRAQRFSWDQCARDTVEVYRRVIVH